MVIEKQQYLVDCIAIYMLRKLTTTVKKIIIQFYYMVSLDSELMLHIYVVNLRLSQLNQ